MRVLAISVHPDDETLGCGGTMLRHRANGDQLFWLIVTKAHEGHWAKDVIAQKAAEVERVGRAYGAERYFQMDFPALHLHAVPEVDLIASVRTVVTEVKPEVVYVVHGGDVHTDHRAVFGATMAVLKPFYMAELGVRRVLSYETLSSTDAAPQLNIPFTPNVFSDITPHMDRKVEIMALYQSEIHPDPLPRSASGIRALGRYRGATIGVEYAEAFVLIRELMT